MTELQAGGLLMNNTILPYSAHPVFEPHLPHDRKLPFIYHHDTVSDRMFANVHENIELLYVTEGSGTVTCDSTSYAVGPGDVIVVNSYVVHQTASNGLLRYFCLIIDRSFCTYHDIDPANLRFSPYIRDEELNTRIHRVIAECGKQQNFSHTGIKCAVLDVLLYVCRHHSCPETNHKAVPSTLKYICAAIHYIKTNLNQKLTVEDAAASAGLSKYYFLREFKTITGYTFTGYVNLIRCEYAKELLMSGHYTVKEAAHLSGFENDSYFTSVFRKCTGSLPSSLLRPELP